MSETAAPQSATAQMIKSAGKGKAAAAKTKAKSKAEEVSTEIDLIVSTVVEIENLSRDAAVALGHSLSDNTDFNYFRLGGVLTVLVENEWFKELGYEDWVSFINSEYGLGKRKAQYLMQIYRGLVESGVKWDDVSGLGWTKLKELSHIMTKDNADEWVKLAKNMTVLELQEAIKKYKTAGSLNAQTDDDEQAAANKTGVSTLTYKVHPDQKETIVSAVEKGMMEIGTEFKAVALEAICMNYLSGETVAAKKEPSAVVVGDLSVELFQKHGWEKVLEMFDEAFPEIEITVKV